MKSVIVLLLASVSAVKVSRHDCGCQQPDITCPPPNYQLNCQKPESAGYGKISSTTKEQTQEAAQAKNLYEKEEDQLKWEGKQNEAYTSNSEQQGSGEITEVMNISGEFEADQQLTDTHCQKDARNAKGATCFKRESMQHLNEIRDCSASTAIAQQSFGEGSQDCQDDDDEDDHPYFCGCQEAPKVEKKAPCSWY